MTTILAKIQEFYCSKS